MDDLNGQRIAVMGGTSGMGLAAAKELRRLGADVVVTGRDGAKAARVTAETGIRADIVDATSEESLGRFYAGLGGLDHLVIAVSGARGAGPFAALAADELRAGFDQKFWPQFLAARIGIAHLRRDGSLTFVSAASARAAMPATVGLAAINGAIEAMVRPLARELKPLRVNAVSPGVVETSWWDRLPGEVRRQILEQSAAASLVGRNGTAGNLADAIVFLIGNSFVTGTVLEVDGGLRLT